ncbi:putative lipid II flippase FtsW [Endothiovibrio diazotrophicus]
MSGAAVIANQNVAAKGAKGAAPVHASWLPPFLDGWLLGAVLALLGLGLVMVASASIGIADRAGDPLHYAERQLIYAVMGLAAAWVVLQSRLAQWERAGAVLLFIALLMLVAVLVPGIGRTVNGATRWLPLGAINLQVSELAKLFILVYLAGYLVRRGEEVCTTVKGFLKPMAVVLAAGSLLMVEPDFGATAVLIATALGMMFLGGARLWLFGLLVAAVSGLGALLAITSPYRMARITGFLDPWADPFDSGFQLTQALIAIGRGEWFGVGLGGSVQKLFYLPEAHTDFLFSVLAEELGMAGMVAVIALFGVVVWRAFTIARQAEAAGDRFGSHLAHGIGLWIGMQAFVNMGVNMGILPTKGLTLPLMSYGGSSLIVMCVALALLLRIGVEARLEVRRPAKKAPSSPSRRAPAKSAPAADHPPRKAPVRRAGR